MSSHGDRPPIAPLKAAPSTLDAGTWQLVIPNALPDVSGQCGDTYVGDISAFEDCAYNAGFNACREQIIEAASTQNADGGKSANSPHSDEPG